MSINYETINKTKAIRTLTLTDKDILVIKNENFIFRKEETGEYPISICIDKSFQ